MGNISDAQEVCRSNGKATDILVNATGLGSKTLKGVEDSTLFPARGQTALVENDPGYMMAVSSGRDSKGLGYCMTRAAGKYHQTNFLLIEVSRISSNTTTRGWNDPGRMLPNRQC